MTETINCDAGRGVFSREECLKCSLMQAQTCGYDYSLLIYLLHDDERTGVHVTDLTGCLRMAYYRRNIQPAEYPHEILIRKLGTAVHAQLENNNSNFRSEMPLEAFGIVGKTDIYYANGRIIDLKTTRWLTPSKLPYGSHATQVNIYAAMLRDMGLPVTSAAIQYIDLSGPTKCRKCNKAYVPINGTLQCPECGQAKEDAHLGALIFEIPLAPHNEVVQQIEERRDALLAALDNNTPPERERTYLCDYCSFVDNCLI